MMYFWVNPISTVPKQRKYMGLRALNTGIYHCQKNEILKYSFFFFQYNTCKSVPILFCCYYHCSIWSTDILSYFVTNTKLKKKEIDMCLR